MRCPRCRTESKPGAAVCAGCGARLAPRAGDEGDERKLVPVFATADSSLLSVVKTALEAAEIPFVVQGEGGMRLFPLGRFALGVRKRVLGATILVPDTVAEEAREFLESFEEGDPGCGDTPDQDEDPA